MIQFIDHGSVVWFSKTIGLFYLVAMAATALAYALWPSKKREFDTAATAILTDRERP